MDSSPNAKTREKIRQANHERELIEEPGHNELNHIVSRKQGEQNSDLRNAAAERFAELESLQRSMEEGDDFDENLIGKNSRKGGENKAQNGAVKVEPVDQNYEENTVHINTVHSQSHLRERATDKIMNLQEWPFEEQFKQLYEVGGEGDRKEFLDDLFTFMQKRGTPVNRVPIMAKQTLDLYLLFKLVVEKGGLVEVINKKIWRDIIKGLNLPSTVTSAAFTLRTQYMKYLYPYECVRLKLSTPAELQAAIDGNRRDCRRPSIGGYGLPDTPGGMTDSNHSYSNSPSPTPPPPYTSINHVSSPPPPSRPISEEVLVPPSVHGNNGVTMVHSPSPIHRLGQNVSQRDHKTSHLDHASTLRTVPIPSSDRDNDLSPPPTKKLAISESETQRHLQSVPSKQWTHIKIQTPPKVNSNLLSTNASSSGGQSRNSSGEPTQLPLTLLDQVSENSLLVSVELNGIVYQGVLFARNGSSTPTS